MWSEEVHTLLYLSKFYFTQLLWGPPFEAERNELVEHRERTINKISSYSLDQYEPDFSPQMKDNVYMLEETYIQVSSWNKKFRLLHHLDILDDRSEYFALRYFKYNFHFNDLAWVHRFINDEEIWVERRFRFAACYCLENEMRYLWHLKTRYGAPRSDGLYIEQRYEINSASAHWDAQLICETRERYAAQYIQSAYSQFLKMGLRIACIMGYEYAAYYFWNNLNNGEKIFLRHSEEFFLRMIAAVESDSYKILFFLYTRLTDINLIRFLNLVVRGKSLSHVWHCLLVSPVTQSETLQFIVAYPYPLPAKLYSTLFLLLIQSIEQLKLPMLREAFQTLWRSVPEISLVEVIQKGDFMELLINDKNVDLFGILIKEHSSRVMEIYFNGIPVKWGYAMLERLAYEREYELFRQCLTSFLTRFDRETNTEVVREDATPFLQSLIQSNYYVFWTSELPYDIRIEINRIVETVQAALLVNQ